MTGAELFGDSSDKKAFGDAVYAALTEFRFYRASTMNGHLETLKIRCGEQNPLVEQVTTEGRDLQSKLERFLDFKDVLCDLLSINKPEHRFGECSVFMESEPGEWSAVKRGYGIRLEVQPVEVMQGIAGIGLLASREVKGLQASYFLGQDYGLTTKQFVNRVTPPTKEYARDGLGLKGKQFELAVLETVKAATKMREMRKSAHL